MVNYLLTVFNYELLDDTAILSTCSYTGHTNVEIETKHRNSDRNKNEGRSGYSLTQ
jgi:hypothetical protein